MVQKGLVQLIRVETGEVPYDVRIEAGCVLRIGELVLELLGPRKLFFIADANVWQCMESRLLKEWSIEGLVVLTVPMGETRKRLRTVEELSTLLHQHGADRSSVVVAIGGGVAGDVAGFVAACYMRGIDFVQVPTTLLAQVDASVGGKTGVNLVRGKNLVGAFHQPRLVLVDPDTLDTLPDREYRAGLQEVVKHGVIRSAPLFDFMESNLDAVLKRDRAAVEHMIAESVRIKAAVVRIDEREFGLRRILNFGHTLGHAFEAETAYKRLLHGEAVGFGMVAAAKLSEMKYGLPASDRQRIEDVVLSYTSFPGLEDVDARQVAARVSGDKKAMGGKVTFIVAERIGTVTEAFDPPAADVIAATEHALWLCSGRGQTVV